MCPYPLSLLAKWSPDVGSRLNGLIVGSPLRHSDLVKRNRPTRSVVAGGISSSLVHPLFVPSNSMYTCGLMCYDEPMASSISVRDLRNTVSEVLRRVEAGERLTVTVDRRPVAEIVPLRRHWTVPADEAFAIASRHAADRRLLREVRSLLPDTTDDV